MKRMSRFARLAIVVTLVGALADIGWSQVTPDVRTSTTETPLFASANSYVQANIPALEKYFLASLEYPSDGVVEAALREITRVKLAQPADSSEPLEEKFKELSFEGNTPAIRYKAMLGLQVFENAELFSVLGNREFKTDDEMFTAISRQLEKSLLADSFSGE